MKANYYSVVLTENGDSEDNQALVLLETDSLFHAMAKFNAFYIEQGETVYDEAEYYSLDIDYSNEYTLELFYHDYDDSASLLDSKELNVY